VFGGIGRMGDRLYVRRYPDILIVAAGSKGPRVAGVDYDAESTHRGEARRQAMRFAETSDHSGLDAAFYAEKFQVMQYEQFLDEVDNVRRSLGAAAT